MVGRYVYGFLRNNFQIAFKEFLLSLEALQQIPERKDIKLRIL